MTTPYKPHPNKQRPGEHRDDYLIRMEEEREYLIEEYRFMRSFNMSHERASHSIGEDPIKFRNRMYRFNLEHITH